MPIHIVCKVKFSNFLLLRTVHEIGPHLFGIHPNGLITFGLSPFELPMMFGLVMHKMLNM